MAMDEKGLASVALTNDNGECRSCVEGQCMTGKNCVTLGWDAYGCSYCKDTGYLSDGNHCQWCAIPMAPAASSAATVSDAASEPEGWKLVPIEPTPAMEDAAGTSVYGHSREQAKEWAKTEKFESAAYVGVEAYRAMLAAAPDAAHKSGG